jgi:hypothetical protein
VSTIRLYAGTGASWSETEVARLVDGTVEVGDGSSTIYPAHVDHDGTVFFGATWTYGPAQTVLGHASETDRAVTEGMSRYGDVIGGWDEDGTVYSGPPYRREKVGRCEPPSGAGAACLLLLFADGAPHKDALIAAAQPGTGFHGLEVKRSKTKKAADPADTAAKAVGIATGVAALGVEVGIARWWHKRKKAEVEQTAASAASSGATPQASDPTLERPANSGATRPQAVWAPRDRFFAEILAEEQAHPGTYLQNEERVPGAVTHQATPEVDIVQPDPAISARPEMFAGDDPCADAEGRSILDHMRTFVDAETMDGQNGVAWAYERRYVSLQDIRTSYGRYLDLKDLVHRFMTRPDD